MVRRAEPEPTDHDERLGEAIEAYLELAEAGQPPDPEQFAARYPDLRDDLCAALEGLSLVRGLVGDTVGPAHRLESGHRIAGYRIVRELGRGGMGVVYEAVHVGLDRPVALKVLGSQAAPDSTGRRRFLNEARTAAGLHHTHIVPVFDVGQVGGLCYYAMQRIEGSGLDRVLRHLRRDRSTAAGSSTGGVTPKIAATQGLPSLVLDETVSWGGRSGSPSSLLQGRVDHDDEPPPYEPPRGSAYYRWVAEVGRQAAEALAHAHHRGIIHRDVKPSNLLVDARGTVWMADFGLARRLADPSVTQHDSLLGTPRYMSPEQAKVGPIDGRTDVYSLGATLYELLTLRPPFEGRTAAELVEQIRIKDPASPRQLDRRIPRDLETIILKALAKRVNDRYATAQELGEDLERFLNHEPVQARRIGPVGRLWRVARRHPGMSVVSTVAAVTVVSVATLAYVRVLHERDRTKVAFDQTKAALRNQLVSQAELVRTSSVPNRRVKGLRLLKEASALGPDAELRAKLRDEATEFLILRDVEARPEFATGRTRAIVFSPDGTRMASLSEDDKLTFWDVESRANLVDHRLRLAAPAEPKASQKGNWRDVRGQSQPFRLGLGLAPTLNKVVVVPPRSGGVRIFDSATGKHVRDLMIADWQVRDVLGSPVSGRFLTLESKATGRMADMGFQVPLFDYRVRLWDSEALEKSETPIAILEEWKADKKTPSSRPLLALGPDGRILATARARGKTVSLWATDDGGRLGSIETPNELNVLAMGPHSQLATAGGGVIRIWDADTKMPLSSLNSNHNLVSLMRFSPSGTLLAIADWRGTELELWDTASNNLVSVLPMADRVSDVAFAPDGHTLAASTSTPSGENRPLAGSKLTTSVWAVIDPLARLQLSGFETQPISLAFRSDGLLALGTSGGSIRYWKPGRCLTSSPSHPDGTEESSGVDPVSMTNNRWITSLAFDDKGRLVSIEPAYLRVWSQPGQSLISPGLPLPGNWPGTNWPMPIAKAADGRTIALVRGSDIFLWRSAEPYRIQYVEPADKADDQFRGGFWRAIAVSPTGNRLYLLDRNLAIHAWTLDGSRAHREWVLPGNRGPTGGLNRGVQLALSADGETLGISGMSRGITLVDTKRGSVSSQLRIPDGEIDGQALTITFSPVGRELVVGSGQGYLYLYSLDQPSVPLARLPGHRGAAFPVSFDTTGRYLAAGSPDKVVDVWDLERIRTELNRLDLGW